MGYSNRKARIDLPFMAKLTGMTEDEVIAKPEGVIFRDVESDRHLTADEYLSSVFAESARSI